MEENEIKIMPLDEFFKKHNVDATLLTNKQKLSILNDFLFDYAVDKDCEEFDYSKLPEESKTKEVTDEHINKIHNIEINQINVLGYIGLIKYIQKEERKLKRKKTFQKVIGVFKGSKK